MLIRLLDITDTSHGAPYNILLVTQKQSAKKTERARRARGPMEDGKQGGMVKKKMQRHLDWRARRDAGRKCDREMTTDDSKRDEGRQERRTATIHGEETVIVEGEREKRRET